MQQLSLAYEKLFNSLKAVQAQEIKYKPFHSNDFISEDTLQAFQDYIQLAKNDGFNVRSLVVAYDSLLNFRNGCYPGTGSYSRKLFRYHFQQFIVDPVWNFNYHPAKYLLNDVPDEAGEKTPLLECIIPINDTDQNHIDPLLEMVLYTCSQYIFEFLTAAERGAFAGLSRYCRDLVNDFLLPIKHNLIVTNSFSLDEDRLPGFLNNHKANANFIRVKNATENKLFYAVKNLNNQQWSCHEITSIDLSLFDRQFYITNKTLSLKELDKISFCKPMRNSYGRMLAILNEFKGMPDTKTLSDNIRRSKTILICSLTITPMMLLFGALIYMWTTLLNFRSDNSFPFATGTIGATASLTGSAAFFAKNEYTAKEERRKYLHDLISKEFPTELAGNRLT